MARLLHVLIMGPPAGGKGTVCSRLVRDMAFQHISSGDLLRTQAHSRTGIGLEAKEHIARGGMVPDHLMVQLVAEELKRFSSSWLLDGFPRTLAQAHALAQQAHVDFAINLDVPLEILVQRAATRWVHVPSGRVYNSEFSPPKVVGLDDVTGEPLTQREDDKEETVRVRLKGYHESTQPVVEYFRRQNKLHVFKGITSDELYPPLREFLKQRLAEV
jgi:nucleoside-triphosphate--adenylate kinase